MKSMKKKIVLLIVAIFFITGVPYLKTPCNCVAVIPLAFTGAIFGCGGEKGPAQQGDAGATANENVSDGKSGDVKVTFVELGSVNCIPCKMMQPVMREIENRYQGQVKVVFHDVWTDQGRAEGMKYAIRVIPTQVFLDSNGKEYFRHEGFFSFEEVDKILKQKGVK